MKSLANQAKMDKAVSLIQEVLKEERVAYQSKMKNRVDSVWSAELMFQALLTLSEEEKFGCLFLDQQNCIIKSEILFTGTVNCCSVYIRELIKKALAYNAAGIIIGHNHPSGNITPSDADRSMTDKIKAACDLMEIKLLDHFIIGKGESYSFAENGNI